MEIKNYLNPAFHMSVDKGDGTKARMSYDLLDQTYESIQEMARVFGIVHERCPNISMWFTLGRFQYDSTGKNRYTGEIPFTIKENTDNEV